MKIICIHFSGAISWGVAANYPQIIEKLVIINAPHSGAFRKKLESSYKQFFKSWYMFAFQIRYVPELYFRTQDLEVFRDMFKNKLSEEELEAYKYNWGRKGKYVEILVSKN
jgi:pimeloyl-ACP methyl ester carboxylesterase